MRYGTLLSFDILRVLEKANPSNSEVGMADTGESVKRLKVEIDTLADEQAEALRSATYIGITPQQDKDYDDRRSRILSLMREVERLEKAA